MYVNDRLKHLIFWNGGSILFVFHENKDMFIVFFISIEMWFHGGTVVGNSGPRPNTVMLNLLSSLLKHHMVSYLNMFSLSKKKISICFALIGHSIQ
jgi:hypothetical protein